MKQDLAEMSWATILTVLRRLWWLLRPTFAAVYIINQRLSTSESNQIFDQVKNWRNKLQERTFNERSTILATLLSLHEMDQIRVQGIVSKAFGVMTAISISVAGLIALVVSDVIGYYAAIPGFYLFLAAASIFFIIEPSPRHTLDINSLIPIDLAGAKLAVYLKLNEADGFIKNNYTVASLYDTVRAIVAAIVVVAISTLA